jgi:hypothetical protein
MYVSTTYFIERVCEVSYSIHVENRARFFQIQNSEQLVNREKCAEQQECDHDNSSR